MADNFPIVTLLGSRMKWEPQDVIRLVAAMMWQGIAAEGAIDLKSSVVSGSLKTGSAGLFIAFLSFFVIMFALPSVSHKASSLASSRTEERSRFKRLLPVFFVLLIALAASTALASAGYHGFIGVAFLSGLLLLIVVIALLTFLETDQ